MKTAITIVVTLVVGFGCGAYLNQLRIGSEISALSAERDSLQMDLDKALRTAEDNAQQTEMLQRQMAALDESFNQFMTVPPPPPEAVMAPPPMEEIDAEPAVTPDQGPAGRPDATMEGPGEGDRDNREERRQAFTDQIRNRVDQFYQDQMHQAPDQATQQRVAAMQQYTDYLMELRMAIRDAATEEDRQALRQTMGETFQALRQVQTEQQNAMLRDLATNYGISDSKAQNEFARAVQDLQNSPFFRPDRMFMGGGGFGGRGGGR